MRALWSMMIAAGIGVAAPALARPGAGPRAAPATDMPPIVMWAYLPPVSLTPPPPAQLAVDPFEALHGMVRHRFASTMIDIYPVQGLGLHLSGGARFVARRNVAREAELLTDGLLYVPRTPRGGVGLRGGFRRTTPAATIGYSETIGDKLLIGVEAGSLYGRAVAPMPRTAMPGPDRRPGLNPVVNMMVALAF